MAIMQRVRDDNVEAVEVATEIAESGSESLVTPS